MKGVNVLLLNEATLVDALQEYINKRTSGPANTVTSIAWNGTAFKVIVEEKAK